MSAYFVCNAASVTNATTCTRSPSLRRVKWVYECLTTWDQRTLHHCLLVTAVDLDPMAGLPPASQPAGQGLPQPAQAPGPSAAAPPQLPQMFGGLANALTPEQHRQLQLQAAEHAQRIQTGLAQPDALRMATSFGAAPPFAGTPQQAGAPQQPRPQWAPQPAGIARPVGAASAAMQHALIAPPLGINHFCMC